jgi:hypothetical protein
VALQLRPGRGGCLSEPASDIQRRRHNTHKVAAAWASALVTLAALALSSPAAANHGLHELVTAGAINGNGPFDASLGGTSSDGMHVFFVTSEPLVSSDTDTRQDVYERFSGTTTRISTGAIGGNGNFDAFFDGASSDGSRVFFTTNEPLVSADTDNQYDVYQRAGGVTTLVSTGPTGGNGASAAFYDGSSADGSHVFFSTDEQLTSADTDARQDVYDRSGGTTTLTTTSATGGNGDFDAYFTGASSSGDVVYFRTFEKLSTGDGDTYQDIYKHTSAGTGQVSIGPVGGNGPYSAAFAGMSKDGNRIFFTTREKLTNDDTDTGCSELGKSVPCTDVYERSGGTTTLVSTGPSGGSGAFEASYEGTSDDGTHVYFSTTEALTSSDTDSSIDLYDRSNSTTTTQISTGPSGGNGAFPAAFAGNSSNGAHAFFTTAESLVGSDTDGRVDIYDRSGTTTTLVSTSATAGNSSFFDAAFDTNSADGSRVFFQTDEALVPADTDGRQDIYERFGGITTLISYGTSPSSALDNFFAGASTDGTRVFFRTNDRLLAGDTDSTQDVYSAIAPSYDYPKDASPLMVPLVPAFRQTISASQCTARGGLNSTHGAPLSNASCNPPGFVPGTQAHFGPQSHSSAQLTAIAGNLFTAADEADLAVSATMNDIRAGSATGADYDPSPSGGDVTLAVELRISDLDSGGSFTDPATVSDTDLLVPVNCTATAGPAGSDCNANTSADAVTPGMIKEGRAMDLMAFRVRVNDAGADNIRGNADDKNFAMQGIYVP